MLFAILDARIDDGAPTPLVILEWTSRKQRRVCRSSLSSEAQSAADAVDALDFGKRSLSLIIDPTQKMTESATAARLGRSPCITDCKALFDAARSASSAGGSQEKRTGIEIQQVAETMKEIGGIWRWTDTHQQMADGLTKVAVRQQFADKLRRGVHALKFDEKFTAGKKIAKQEIIDREKRLDEFADTLNAEDEELILEYKNQAEMAVQKKKKAPNGNVVNKILCKIAAASTVVVPVKANASVVMTVEDNWEFEVCVAMFVICVSTAFLLGRWSATVKVETPISAVPMYTQTSVAAETIPTQTSLATLPMSTQTIVAEPATTPSASSWRPPLAAVNVFVTSNNAEVYHTGVCRYVADFERLHKRAPRSLRACYLCGH